MPEPKCKECDLPCQNNDGECPKVAKPITELSTAEQIALMIISAQGKGPGNPED